MLTPERLREIKERCERATKGPWTNYDPKRGLSKSVYLQETAHEQEDIYGGPSRYGPHRDYIANFLTNAAVSKEQALYNATFCAHSREDVPALVAEVERLWELRDELRGLIDFLRRQADGLRRLARERTTDAEGEAALYGHVDGLEIMADALEERLGAMQHAERRGADRAFIAHALVAEAERLQELANEYRLHIEHLATILGCIQTEAEALRRLIHQARANDGKARLDDMEKLVQAIFGLLEAKRAEEGGGDDDA